MGCTTSQVQQPRLSQDPLLPKSVESTPQPSRQRRESVESSAHGGNGKANDTPQSKPSTASEARGFMTPVIKASLLPKEFGFKANLSRANAFSQLEKKYELGALLGEGITGQVRLCTSKVDGLVYAMKSLNVAKMDDMQLNELRAEIGMLKHLDHPNVVSLIETFESDSNICLVMEYCGGGDLSDRRFRTERDLASVLNQILRAVAHCHKLGVVHRDLKLENVLFLSKNSDSLRLIDFGLSKTFFQNTRESTGQGNLDRLNDKSRALETVCGTVCYMAPEILSKSYTEKADVWAVGVIAYTLMTGAPPFLGDSETDILRLVKKGVVGYDEHVWKRLSKDAQDFVKSLLTVDPEHRPSAVQALHHPWLVAFREKQLKLSPIPRDLARRACEAMLQFASYPLLKKVAFMFIAHHCSDKDKAPLQELFLYLDDDFDGELEPRHLKKLGREFAPDLALNEQQSLIMFNVLDQDRTGYIHHMEFLSATIESVIKPSAKLIDQAFDHLDADSSGVITAANIHDLLGSRYSEQDAIEILEQGFLSLDMAPQPGVTRSQFFQMMEYVGLPSPFSVRISPNPKPRVKLEEIPSSPTSAGKEASNLSIEPVYFPESKVSDPLESIQE